MRRSHVRGLVLATALLVAAPAGADDPAAAGQKLFKNEGCPQCHGFGGKGDGYLLGMLKEPVKMHDWTDPEQMRAFDDVYLFDITKKGGAAMGKNKVMIKYGNKLSDEQIRLVIAYVRSVGANPPAQ